MCYRKCVTWHISVQTLERGAVKFRFGEIRAERDTKEREGGR